jgi:hypothetical protein
MELFKFKFHEISSSIEKEFLAVQKGTWITYLFLDFGGEGDKLFLRE